MADPNVGKTGADPFTGRLIVCTGYVELPVSNLQVNPLNPELATLDAPDALTAVGGGGATLVSSSLARGLSADLSLGYSVGTTDVPPDTIFFGAGFVARCYRESGTATLAVNLNNVGWTTIGGEGEQPVPVGAYGDVYYSVDFFNDQWRVWSGDPRQPDGYPGSYVQLWAGPWLVEPPADVIHLDYFVVRVYYGVPVATAPPLRIHPRNDGLTGGAQRVFPPAKSVQRSNRRGPGSYL